MGKGELKETGWTALCYRSRWSFAFTFLPVTMSRISAAIRFCICFTAALSTMMTNGIGWARTRLPTG
jgi:hypothetical protein